MSARGRSRAAGQQDQRPAPRASRKPPLSRARLREIVRTALEPLPFVHALWEGGSTAFARDDAWSDVDLQACVDDERVAETFAAIEEALSVATEIESIYHVPEPAWHGHAQRFYRFRNEPPWLMLDLCVQKRSNENRFLEAEIHGRQVFLFDKVALADALPPPDADAWDKRLRARLEALRARTAMFAILVEKECRRQRPIDAIAFYQSLIIAPLVELLRIRHDPWRHNFGMRYLHHALPAPLARRLEELLFVRNFPDLQTKQRVALRWFAELADDLSRMPRLVYPAGGAAKTKPDSATKTAPGQTNPPVSL